MSEISLHLATALELHLVVVAASPPARVIKNRNVVPYDSMCAKVYI